MSSNPHASPSKLSANSFFFTCAHTHTGKKMASRTFVQATVARAPTVSTNICFYNHTQFRDLYEELISSFKWLRDGDDSRTLQTQLMKSRVKKCVTVDKQRSSGGQTFCVEMEIAGSGGGLE